MLGRAPRRAARHVAPRPVPRVSRQGSALLSTGRSRICVFYNPEAGASDADEALAVLAADPSISLERIEDPGSLPERVRAVARAFDAVAAAGGDGTVGSVATGLYLARRDDADGVPPLAVLPLGTGNDFARHLGVPRDPVKALDAAREALAVGRRTWIDLVACTSPQLPGELRYALNAVVGGLGGKVADALTPALRRRWGRFAYLRAALPDLLRCPAHSIVMHVDGRRFDVEALLLVIAGGRFAAGGIPLAPKADPADGRLDVVAIERPALPRFPATVLRVLAGRHGETDDVLEVAGRHVVLEAGSDFWMNLDGETWAAGSASFRVVPRAFRLLAP